VYINDPPGALRRAGRPGHPHIHPSLSPSLSLPRGRERWLCLQSTAPQTYRGCRFSAVLSSYILLYDKVTEQTKIDLFSFFPRPHQQHNTKSTLVSSIGGIEMYRHGNLFNIHVICDYCDCEHPAFALGVSMGRFPHHHTSLEILDYDKPAPPLRDVDGCCSTV